jgi:signal transduction histidine kinase
MLATATWLVRVGACILIGIFTFAISPTTGHDLWLEIVAFTVSVAVVGCWLRIDVRRWIVPRPATTVGLGVMAALSGVACLAPNGGALVGFPFIATLAASADTAWLSGWLVTATSILAIEVSAIIYSGHTGSAVAYPLGLLVAFIGGRNRRAYLLQAEQSAAILAQLEQLRAEQRNVAVLDERTRIAREVHDVLAHSLGALGIQIQAVRAVLTDHRDIEHAVALLSQAQRMATEGLVETRRAVQALRGDSTRLDEQIGNLAVAHRGLHRSDVDFEIDGEPADLLPEATVALVRTAQEALVNSAKHAPHQNLVVRLNFGDDRVSLTVTNPLPPADIRHDNATQALDGVNGGYGLTGMSERLLLIRGTLRAGADAGLWTVHAEVPR